MCFLGYNFKIEEKLLHIKQVKLLFLEVSSKGLIVRRIGLLRHHLAVPLAGIKYEQVIY